MAAGGTAIIVMVALLIAAALILGTPVGDRLRLVADEPEEERLADLAERSERERRELGLIDDTEETP